MLLQITEPGKTEEQTQPNATAIGIDLGTTNSVVAYAHEGNIKVIENGDHGTLVPSVVGYSSTESRPLIGYDAVDHLKTSAAEVVVSAKRLMGKSTAEAQQVAGKFTLADSQATDNMVRLKVGEHMKTPVEVSADLLRHLKGMAEADLGHAVTEAVITVPAYFDEAARSATKEAAHLAGLKVLRLINEPTAAALAYGLDQNAEGVYAIYDLGGGTFDFSLLKLSKGVFQVIATSGDTSLGGDDIDHLIVEHFLGQWSIDALSPDQYKQALRQARAAKEHLSKQTVRQFQISGKTATLDQETLKQLSVPLIERTIDICRKSLLDADKELDDIKGIVLVGGSTKMPLIRDRVEAFFKKKPLDTVDPDEVVAQGAAHQAAALTQGSETLLLDVTPLSLGMETLGGLNEVIIPRNSPIPIAKCQEFTTSQDGQTALKIHIVQGERELVQYCRTLADFVITDIPPMAAGAARIAVTFRVDADGLLTIAAEEKTTQQTQEIQVKPAYGLSEEDVRRILAENAEHGAEDLEERLLSQARVEAEQIMTSLQDALGQDSALLEKSEMETLDSGMKKLKSLLESEDRVALADLTKQLALASQSFAERRISKAVKTNLSGQTLETVDKQL